MSNNGLHLSLGQYIKTMLSTAALQLIGIDAAPALRIANGWQIDSDAQAIKVLDCNIPPIAGAAQAPTIEVIEIKDSDWQSVLTSAIVEGRASRKDVISLMESMNEHAPGLKPLDWKDIEALALDYKERGHKYDSQRAFADSTIYSYRTVQRSLKDYEVVTGDQLRPGRGRSRKAAPKRRR